MRAPGGDRICVGEFSSLLYDLLFYVVACTRRVAMANGIATKNRRVPNIAMTMGKRAHNAVASVSNDCRVRIGNGRDLVFSFMNCRAMAVPMGEHGIVGMRLGRTTRVMSRMIVAIPCNATGGSAFAKSTDCVTTNAVRGTRIDDMSGTLRKAMTNLRSFSSDNRPKSSTAVLVHKINSMGTSAGPLCIISNIPCSNTLSSVTSSSVTSVAMLGSTTSTTLCNSHTTGNMVVVAAGRKGGSDTPAIRLSTGCNFSDHTQTSCSRLGAGRCCRLC